VLAILRSYYLFRRKTWFVMLVGGLLFHAHRRSAACVHTAPVLALSRGRACRNTHRAHPWLRAFHYSLAAQATSEYRQACENFLP